MKRSLYILLLLVLVCSQIVVGCRVIPINIAGGKTLNLYGIDPLMLDPAVSGEMTSHEYIMQLFSGLVRLDDDLKPVPDISQKWKVSNDSKTYTFYLRQDVKFHDGKLVKAQDFKYSWERACDPATGSLTADTYLGDIVGVKEMLAGKSKDVSGVRVIDDYTLQVTIDAPKSYFLYKLTYPTAFVVDSANVKSGSEWWHKPNGTGPFKLKQWDANSLLILEKNKLYYGKQAEVDFVTFYLYGGVPMDLYETGKIDATGVSLDYIDKVTDKTGNFYRELTVVPELSFFYIGFNTAKPPFDDVNIRRAFSQAIDKEKLASLVFRDMVQSANGILPLGIPGFNDNLSGLNYDVDEAKRLIRESKYGDVSKLPPITITTAGMGGLVSQDLEAIIYRWRENLGVEVKVRQIEELRFLYHLEEERDEMFYMGWVADYPHPQDFLDVLFHSGTKSNYGDYSNPEIDALLDKASLELDEKTSLALYQQAEQKLVEDAACVPLWYGRNYILTKPKIKGYKVNALGFAMLNGVSIAP